MLVAGIFTLAAGLGTVTFAAMKAATINPAETLRKE